MPDTLLEYMEDMYRYTGNATVTDVFTDPDGSTVLLLDRTIFYPQGGGQLCDIGFITGLDFRFTVRSVVFSAGQVSHYGSPLEGSPRAGAPVNLMIEPRRRIENSRLQSAGHLLLNAVVNLALPLVPVKGYHFPDGPYVEFSGSVAEAERESLVERLQVEVDHLIALDTAVECHLVSLERLDEICQNIPANLPSDKPIRVVTIEGVSQPCGGTHVRSVRELRGMKVEHIKQKKGNTRISYSFRLNSGLNHPP